MLKSIIGKKSIIDRKSREKEIIIENKGGEGGGSSKRIL